MTARGKSVACCAVAGILAVGAGGLAQNPPAQNPPAGRGAAQPAQRGGGGGGRGRGAIQVMTLTTTAWTDGGVIPSKYSQAGHDVSPPLEWSDAPTGTTNFVLLVHDVDSPAATLNDDLLQWLVWNIPATSH